MIGKNDKKEIEKIIQRSKNDLDTINRLQKTAIDKLPGQCMPQISEALADYNTAMRSLKKMDTEPLNKLISKYANINR